MSEMTYTVSAPLPKIQFTLLHIRETERYPKLQKLNPNFHMAKTILLPIFSLFLITLGHWLKRKSPFRYTNIRFRYLFLKSRKHAPPKRILYAFSKLIMFLFIASTFDAKTPSKAHYDLEVEIKEHCELFTDQYIEISEIIRSTNLREQCSLYALSKLKFSKRLWYFKYLLLLSGDINLHPGPVKCPCLVCSRSVRKREISCDKCGLWVHKKCKSSTNSGNEHPFICNQCLNNENDISQNAWNLFPFANDFFCNNTGALPVEKTVEKTVDDLDEVLSKDKWNIFNKRGLHMIHLNINSVLSKIDELRVVAKKSKAAVIGVTESKLDATVLDGEVNIDGYEVIRSDRNRHGGGVACYVRNDINFNVRRDFSDEIENIVFDMLLPKTKPILEGFLYRPPNQSKELSSRGKLNCGVPQGSILGPLPFLLYVNDMPQAVNSELLLYADDTCLFFVGKDSKIIGDQLNKDFNSLCEWFIDNKLSIHFREEKTKSILFGTKQLLHKAKSLKGELQRQSMLISSERPFEILQNETKIIKIGQAVLEIFNFKD